MVEIMFLDGEPFRENVPLRSLLYGEGLFETFRWDGSPPVHMKKHLDRMRRGAEFLSIPFPGEDGVESDVERAMKISGITDAHVKVCLLSSGGIKFHGRAEKGHVLVVVRDYGPQKERMRAHIAPSRRNSSSPLLRVKSMNYLENVLARRGAIEKGYDEAVFLNERDEVAEGSATNIFWVKRGVLYTPAVGCGLLPGITREVLISLAPKLDLGVEEGIFGLDEILSSDGAFLTNSLIGISALSDVDGDEIALDAETFGRIRTTLFRELRWVP